jgi:transcriptional regulator GlxA family with amidase domain
MRTQIVLFDGFDPLDVIAPYEVLAAGGMVTGGAVTVELVSAEGPRDVPSGLDSLSLRATAHLRPSTMDLILVPGALGRLPDGDEPADDSIPAILGRTLGTALPALLKEALDRPGLLAGLIAGRPATTHHMGLELLGTTGVRVVDARVVDDGDLVTGATVTSGLDLGLYLLEREVGPQVALAVERLVAHERRGTVWRATGTAPAGGV